jgi:hypothetical protein
MCTYQEPKVCDDAILIQLLAFFDIIQGNISYLKIGLWIMSKRPITVYSIFLLFIKVN